MMAWTERAIDTIESLAGDSFRRVGSLRLAVDEEERDELRTEYEALVAAGFAAEWIESFEPPLAGRFTAALRHLPDGVLQPARWVRRLAALAAEAGVEIREHTRVASLEELGGATVVVCTDGYPSGLLGDDRGADHPDARPGDRDRAGPRALLRGAALRAARLRLLAPGRGRAHRRRRLPRRVVRLGVHRRRAADRARADRAARASSTT